MANKLSYVIIIALAAVCIAILHEKSGTNESPVVVAPNGASVATPAMTPSIEVNAAESRRFQADKFLVHVSLSKFNVDRHSLFKQMESGRQRILNIVKELELSEKDVQQNSIELHKEWSYNNGVRKFSQFNATQNFVITVEDKQAAANLVEALSTEFDVDVGRTVATLKDVEKQQKAVVDAAGKKALEKAEMYAGSVGVKLGKILNIGTGYGDGVISEASDGVMLMTNGPMMKGARLNRNADMNAIADSVTLSAEIRLVVEIKQ